MTILLTACRHCGGNHMMLDTETLKGSCVACGRDQVFTKEDVAAAELWRDNLSEKYLGLLEKAYESKDAGKMRKLAVEVAKEGISSWYAWFCVGWADIQDKKLAQAFEDFNLAACFIEEEDFDEFYELVMDSTIESLLASARELEQWNQGDDPFTDFTQVMFERFEPLTECDFMTDLLKRMAALTDSIESAAMGAGMVNEITMIIEDYCCANTFIPDIQEMLYASKSSVEAIGEVMREKAQDRSMPPKLVEFVSTGMVELVDVLLGVIDSIASEYSEDDLFGITMYWAGAYYEDVSGFLQAAVEYQVGYVMSGKRNKGILKKRDKALEDFRRAFLAPLTEGILGENAEDKRDFDRICPDCGKPLTADDTGLMQCECGFRSRVVTSAIDDLPEDLAQLEEIGRKAFLDRDPSMLNNIGEKYLDLNRESWYGYLALGSSCIIDREVSQGLMLYSQGLPYLGDQKYAVFREIFLALLPEALTTTDDIITVDIFMSMFYDELASNIGKSELPMELLEGLSKRSYSSSSQAQAALTVIPPTVRWIVSKDCSLSRMKVRLHAIKALLDSVEGSVDAMDSGKDRMKGSIKDYIRNLRELLDYAIDGIDARASAIGDEKIGYLMGYWESNPDDYQDVCRDMTEGLTVEEGEPHMKNSPMLKNGRKSIDKFLDSYVRPIQVN